MELCGAGRWLDRGAARPVRAATRPRPDRTLSLGRRCCGHTPRRSHVRGTGRTGMELRASNSVGARSVRRHRGPSARGPCRQLGRTGLRPGPRARAGCTRSPDFRFRQLCMPIGHRGAAAIQADQLKLIPDAISQIRISAPVTESATAKRSPAYVRRTASPVSSRPTSRRSTPPTAT